MSVFDFMLKQPDLALTVENFVAINWLGEKTLADLEGEDWCQVWDFQEKLQELFGQEEPRGGRMKIKCIDCGEETLPDGCWQCLENPRLHPILREPQFCEGVPCLRRVEIESDFSFEILYLRTESNVVALDIAVQRCPRAKFFRVTPVWE